MSDDLTETGRLREDREFWKQRTESMQSGLNGLYMAIVERLEPHFPPGSRELEMDVLPSAVGGLAKERDRLRDELAEARATLAAERGEAEGAPSEGWAWKPAGWMGPGCGAPMWEHKRFRWYSVMRHRSGAGWMLVVSTEEHRYGTAREAMRAADAALATTEPPDAP